MNLKERMVLLAIADEFCNNQLTSHCHMCNLKLCENCITCCLDKFNNRKTRSGLLYRILDYIRAKYINS